MLERESQKNNKLLFDVAHKIYELEIKKNKLIGVKKYKMINCQFKSLFRSDLYFYSGG